ncbi:hypothetical protein IWQ60_003187 [Tieghemiomyces parasiticus]|uniref:Uncharacterized protein n=1 Tax=Tieghemiomyces parasiticus TaxID=78921 RepID=A0A9W8ADQ6_9FUNG|nr:hypothetical protein IWQ60_003187 [Tieghemiomyces parasiticus]
MGNIYSRPKKSKRTGRAKWESILTKRKSTLYQSATSEKVVVNTRGLATPADLLDTDPMVAAPASAAATGQGNLHLIREQQLYFERLKKSRRISSHVTYTDCPTETTLAELAPAAAHRRRSTRFSATSAATTATTDSSTLAGGSRYESPCSSPRTPSSPVRPQAAPVATSAKSVGHRPLSAVGHLQRSTSTYYPRSSGVGQNFRQAYHQHPQQQPPQHRSAGPHYSLSSKSLSSAATHYRPTGHPHRPTHLPHGEPRRAISVYCGPVGYGDDHDDHRSETLERPMSRSERLQSYRTYCLDEPSHHAPSALGLRNYGNSRCSSRLSFQTAPDLSRHPTGRRQRQPSYPTPPASAYPGPSPQLSATRVGRHTTLTSARPYSVAGTTTGTNLNVPHMSLAEFQAAQVRKAQASAAATTTTTPKAHRPSRYHRPAGLTSALAVTVAP